MTELEKLKAGLEYDMTDPEVDSLKLRAVKRCQKLNSNNSLIGGIPAKVIKELMNDVDF